LPVVPPKFLGGVDVALLPLLRAAGQQDQQQLSVAPEIDAVSRPKVDPVFEHAFAGRLYARPVACPMRAATLARGTESSPANYSAKGLRRSPPTYNGASRIGSGGGGREEG